MKLGLCMIVKDEEKVLEMYENLEGDTTKLE